MAITGSPLDGPADCTLACDEGHLTAHKILLCAHSKYLLDILSNFPEAEHPIIILTEINIIDIRILVNYMYTGELTITNDCCPSNILRAAKILRIESLTDFEDEDDTLADNHSINHHHHHHSNLNSNHNNNHSSNNQHNDSIDVDIDDDVVDDDGDHDDDDDDDVDNRHVNVSATTTTTESDIRFRVQEALANSTCINNNRSTNSIINENNHKLLSNNNNNILPNNFNTIQNLSNIISQQSNINLNNNNNNNNNNNLSNSINHSSNNSHGKTNKNKNNHSNNNHKNFDAPPASAVAAAAAAVATASKQQRDGPNNKIRCHLCNIGLSDVKCLYRHVLTRHLSEKWGYKCEFCDREFSRDDHLMRHYTTKHKNMEFNREKIRETRRLNREMAKNYHDQISKFEGGL